jgi:DnaK suppressor protein
MTRSVTDRATPDVNDAAIVGNHDDVEMALIQIAADTLRRFDLALQRLEQGAYGDCSECGQPITSARLEALPFALRCIGCETEREKQLAQARMPARRGVYVDFTIPD